MKEASTLKYYKHGISRLRSALEELTQIRITDSMLEEAISLCNRGRKLLRDISETRKSENVPISGKDFAEVCHGSLLADKKFMINVLEVLYEELKGKTPLTSSAPRILLTGSTLAMGDYRVLDLIEEAGGTVVVEEFAEGIPPYWEDVKPDGDLMQSLADCYFMRRISPAWFRPGKERLDLLVKLVKDFNVDGVIWYQLMYRESYKTESYYFPERLKREAGLPMLTIDSDYDPSETGQLRTRIEAFIETLRR
jgi:benzoyl-CoA reductase/2-hydroxyglutaryl-CoA dehydratase subunit BcrC/BadD/HgdB